MGPTCPLSTKVGFKFIILDMCPKKQ